MLRVTIFFLSLSFSLLESVFGLRGPGVFGQSSLLSDFGEADLPGGLDGPESPLVRRLGRRFFGCPQNIYWEDLTTIPLRQSGEGRCMDADTNTELAIVCCKAKQLIPEGNLALTSARGRRNNECWSSAEGIGGQSSQACSVEDILAKGKAIAKSLDCELQKANNLLAIVAAGFERVDQMPLAKDPTEVTQLEDLQHCKCRVHACNNGTCTSCNSELRYSKQGHDILILMPQPESTGSAYSYRGKDVRSGVHQFQPTEMMIDKDRIDRALSFAVLGSTRQSFLKSPSTEHLYFTDGIQTRLEYRSSDPAIIETIWTSNRLKDRMASYDPCRWSLNRNLIDPVNYRRFFKDLGGEGRAAIKLDGDEDEDELSPTWSKGLVDRENFFHVSASKVVLDRTRKPVGIVSLGINMSYFSEELGNLNFTPSSSAAIISADGGIISMTQSARDFIFTKGLSESKMRNPRDIPPCIGRGESHGKHRKDCWWVSPEPLSLKNASYDGWRSSYQPLIQQIFSASSDCSDGMNFTKKRLPRRVCPEGKDEQAAPTVGKKRKHMEDDCSYEAVEHMVVYCNLNAVSEWAFMVMTPYSEMMTASSIDLSNETFELEVPYNITNRSKESAEVTLTNTGRVPFPFLVNISLPTSLASVHPMKGTLEPGNSRQIRVTFNLSNMEAGNTSGLMFIIPNYQKPNGRCFLEHRRTVSFNVIRRSPLWRLSRLEEAVKDHAAKLVILLTVLVGFFVYRTVDWLLARYYAMCAKEEAIVQQAILSTSTVSHPMVLLRLRVFKDLGKLVAHEEVLQKSIWLHTMNEIDEFTQKNKVIFFSHQWTAFASPDPTGKQYEQMVMAANTLVATEKWRDDETYVWLDYSSIPQRHRGLQTLAINSLTVYAAKVSAFVVVAPQVVHEDLKEVCDTATYQRRAWCRAEQLSHLLARSSKNMFLAEGGSLSKLTDEWLEQSMLVFDGDLTCCRRHHEGMDLCDKQRLVVPMLGLWAELCRRVDSCDGTEEELGFKEIHGRIEDRLDDIFPRRFDLEINKKKKNKRLFGNSVNMIHARLFQNDTVDVQK
eukprot:TRINITY_DN80300_c0_g1_i1.p1 TRINITY_DN80300_c0_g1~~TRINITY_DN80300_c0_g1_i1.p1  ORF type:complete len:1058 (-),score=131.43 TRINITY_DN80300_c0_g1_i1:146-3319(-)